MTDGPLDRPFSLFQTVYSNLKSFRIDCIFFAGVVPLALTAIFLLPPELKYLMVLNTKDPTPVSAFLSNFTHLSDWHLKENIAGYMIALAFIFPFERNRKLFRSVSLILMMILPFVVSWYTVSILGHLSIRILSMGFSAIGWGYLGYSAYAVSDFVKSFKAVTPSAAIFLILFITGASLIVFQAPFAKGGAVNLSAHLIGFVLGALMPFMYSLLNDTGIL